MRRRYLYVLMFSVPALLASVIIAVAVIAGAAGALWLFVYGDNPWPESADTTLIVLFAIACVASCVVCLSVAYAAGRRQEESAALSRTHVAASVGATALLVALIVAHQWGVGNVGTPSDSVLCSQFCAAKGYSGSGMPPRDSGIRTCSCYDAQGREAVKAPLEETSPGGRK
jgi:hypothetical protein